MKKIKIIEEGILDTEELQKVHGGGKMCKNIMNSCTGIYETPPCLVFVICTEGFYASCIRGIAYTICDHKDYLGPSGPVEDPGSYFLIKPK